MAASVAARVVLGVALPWLADRLNAPRRVLAGLAAVGAALFASHLLIDSRPVLLAATMATAAVTAGVLPVADALTLRAARRGGWTYSTARALGSAAFLAANLACGLAVARYGSGAALWWIVLSFLPLIWLGLRHPGGAGAPVARPQFGDAMRLLKSPAFIAAMVAAAAMQAAHAPLYAYGSIHWSAAGVDDETIGALWAWGVALEVCVLAFLGKAMIARLGVAGAFALGGLAGLIRWGVMISDPSGASLWAAQALHALTFTAPHLAAMAFVDHAAPATLTATAQGLVGALAGGAFMALNGFLAAVIYPLAGSGVFWLGFGFCAIGLIATLALAVLWRRNAKILDSSS